MNCDVCGYYMLHCRCPEDLPVEAQSEISQLQAEVEQLAHALEVSERGSLGRKLQRDIAQAQRDRAWNDAIEAAAECLERNWMETSAYKVSAIRALKRTRGM